MSIIENKQVDLLLGKASENNFENPENIIDVFTKILSKSDFRYNPSFGKPLAPFYQAMPRAAIDKVRIKDFFTYSRYDLLTVHNTLDELRLALSHKILDYQTSVLNQESRLTAVIQEAKTSKLKTDLGVDWFYSEPFTDLVNTDQSATTAWIDTFEGVVTLPAETKILTPQVRNQDEVEVDIFNSTVSNLFDNDPKTAWYGSFKSLSARLVCELIADLDINQIYLDPIGANTAVLIEVYSDGWVTKLNEVLLQPTTFNLAIKANDIIRVTITSIANKAPSTAGLRSLNLMAKTFTESAEFRSTAITPIFGFSELMFKSKKSAPPGTEINHYWSFDNINWLKITEDVWNKVTDTNSILSPINIGALSSVGTLYQSETLDGTSVSTKDGEILVGLNQFEITASKNANISNGDLAPLPSEDMLVSSQKNTVWHEPSTSINSQVSGQVVSVQLVDSSSAPHVTFTRGNTLIASQDIEERYTALTMLPIYGTPQQQSCQPFYVYKMSCKFYATENVSFDQAKAWFLQGFRSPSSKTFKQLNRFYGTYALYINDLLVSASNQPYTLYTDNTAETGASAGDSHSFYIRKGWNSYDLYVYCPETLLVQSDPNTSTRMLQLTLYPNIFDPNFKTDYKITQIVGSGPQKPTNDFDLAWHLPKSFKYWSWRSYGVPNVVLFNTSDVESLDGFIAKSNKSLYRPNLLLNSNVKATDGSMGLNNSSSIYIKSVLKANASQSDSPLLQGYEILTR